MLVFSATTGEHLHTALIREMPRQYRFDTLFTHAFVSEGHMVMGTSNHGSPDSDPTAAVAVLLDAVTEASLVPINRSVSVYEPTPKLMQGVRLVGMGVDPEGKVYVAQSGYGEWLH
ncbi:hypothetical protein KIPB_001171 [Kipferlia bialata]|uniref:Uncharacterized protein n=1 Tax=Kipferlia bialata TaxID=797122 RepID=A0A9K3CNK2_9EUKA|nr:hypothetical protein KIPB_001171 [Kipferlia bialata]|eukprot:g1171.t1